MGVLRYWPPKTAESPPGIGHVGESGQCAIGAVILNVGHESVGPLLPLAIPLSIYSSSHLCSKEKFYKPISELWAFVAN